MKNVAMRSVLIVGAILCVCPPLAGQVTFTGLDDFNDNALTVGPGERWQANTSTGSGTSAFNETSQHLEYTGLTNGSVTGRRMLTWFSDTSGNPSYTESWTATAFASNLATGLTALAQVGVEVYNPATNAGYFGVYLYRDSGGDTKIYVTNYTFNGTSYVEANAPWAVTVSATTIADVQLGIAFDVGTGTLSAIYRLDTGSAFTVVDAGSPGYPAYATVSPASTWAAAPTSGFGFRLIGHSSLDTIGTGTLYLDTFAVATAVPEPSAYGVVLGTAALVGVGLSRRLGRPNRS